MGITEINGRPATADDLSDLAFAGYGHFTSMQIRDYRVRGLDLHLERLRQSSIELFGQEVGDERVRAYLRHVVRPGPGDLSVQINVFSSDGDATLAGRPVQPDVLIRTGPPVEVEGAPIRATTARFERFLPHIKNVATMGLTSHWREAKRAGFDDVLFVDGEGFIAEGSIWNVVFLDGDGLVWPDAPALPGITMQLVQAGLPRLHLPFQARPVHVSELSSFQAAALMNSWTPAQPLSSVDDVVFPDHRELVETLRRAYLVNPLQPV